MLLLIVVAVFGLYWAWKYYGLPEWPDHREYKTIEEWAEKALAFAKRHNFTDAIYITGGADYVFYRDIDGVRHDIGDTVDYPHEKWKGIIPWLVFRK